MSDLGNFTMSGQWDEPVWPELEIPETLQLAFLNQPQFVEGTVETTDASAFGLASNLDALLPNVVLISNDRVRFYVHWHKLLHVSSNSFGNLLPPYADNGRDDPRSSTFMVEESATVINIVLHTMYNMSCAAYNPPFDAVASAIESLKMRGVSLEECLAPGMPFYNLFLNQAPLRSIEAFVIAAENNLENLAVAISPLLLAVCVENVSDEFAARMGGIYMRRLAALQLRRIYSLQGLLLTSPYPHASTRGCKYPNRQALMRAWSLSVAALAVNIRPDLSGTRVESFLGSLEPSISCQICKKSFRSCVDDIVQRWVLMQRTI